MKQKLVKVLRSVDALTLRERLFVFAAILVVVGGVWEAFLASPLEAREQLASDRVQATKQRLDELNASITAAANGMSDGMPNHLERLRMLREQVADGEEAVRIFTSDLVDPTQMRFVLEDLIRRQSGLELLNANNLEVRPVLEPTNTEQEDETSDSPKLYRHGLVLVLEGTYLDCLEYLEAVERLPWQLYWTRLQLQIEDYPRSRITLELHTLSLEEEWLGV